MKDKALAQQWFPLLHHPITENYTYRGGWGTLAITIILFVVSAFTKKTEPAKLEKTTIDWSGPMEPFAGLSDWRLHLAILSVVTVAAYWWIW